MKNIRIFVSENFQFLEVKVSIYLNRHVFVMSLLILTLSYEVIPVNILQGTVKFTFHPLHHENTAI